MFVSYLSLARPFCFSRRQAFIGVEAFALPFLYAMFVLMLYAIPRHSAIIQMRHSFLTSFLSLFVIGSWHSQRLLVRP